MSSFDLGPPPPPPRLTRSYNTEQVPIRNENAKKIQKEVRGKQARKKVEEMKRKQNNLALATINQGVHPLTSHQVQHRLKRMLGVGGSRRQRTHKRKQNKRKTLHKRKSHKRKTHKRKTNKKRRH